MREKEFRDRREWRLANTKENGTKVQYLSITFLIAFEKDCKSLERLQVERLSIVYFFEKDDCALADFAPRQRHRLMLAGEQGEKT